MARKTSTSTEIAAIPAEAATGKVAQMILDFVGNIPHSKVDASGRPEEEAKRIANASASKAGLTAGSLALPPGPLGWLTVLPELVAIWKIQAQMVSDIAHVFGKDARLGREQMLYCLFRHTAAQAFRDVVIRLGDRLVFRRASMAALNRIAQRVGVSVTQRTVGKGITRWLPVVGALGVGAYAYYDTAQVAKTAIDLFSGVIDVEAEDVTEPPAPTRPRVRAAVAKKATSVKKAVKTVVRKTAAKAAKGAVKKAATAGKKAVAKRAARRKPKAE
jgi:hypothetical protein